MKRTKKKNIKSLEIELIKKLARLKKGEQLDNEHQELYDLHKSRKRKFRRLKIHVNEKNEQWSIDLAEMNDLTNYNNKIKYWLVCVDVFSRYAWVKLLTNKKSKTVGDAFEEIIKEADGPPKLIQSDEGSEFQIIRKELSKKYGFKVFHTYNREIKAAHAERFIGTIKQMLRRVLTGISKFRYRDLFHIVLERYNEMPHKSLGGKSPKEIYRSKKKIHSNYFKDLSNPVLVKNLLKEGQKVRISRVSNSTFEKANLRRWVKEKLIINKVYITDPPTYSLVDEEGESITGIFYREELMPIRK